MSNCFSDTEGEILLGCREKWALSYTEIDGRNMCMGQLLYGFQFIVKVGEGRGMKERAIY